MPSKDEKRTTRKKRAVLTDREGDELEPIIDPVELDVPVESPPAPKSAADAVDDLLGDEAGRNGSGAPMRHARERVGERGRQADVDGELADEAGHDERGVTTDDVLESIVRSQRASKLRLGDILKEMGLVTDEQIVPALSRQKETRKRLGQLLIDDGVVTQLDLTKALATKFGVSFLDLT